MLLMCAGYEVGKSLILPVAAAFMFMTSWTNRAIARNRRGASKRRPVAQRLRHATRTAQFKQESSSHPQLQLTSAHVAAAATALLLLLRLPSTLLYIDKPAQCSGGLTLNCTTSAIRFHLYAVRLQLVLGQQGTLSGHCAA